MKRGRATTFALATMVSYTEQTVPNIAVSKTTRKRKLKKPIRKV